MRCSASVSASALSPPPRGPPGAMEVGAQQVARGDGPPRARRPARASGRGSPRGRHGHEGRALHHRLRRVALQQRAIDEDRAAVAGHVARRSAAPMAQAGRERRGHAHARQDQTRRRRGVSSGRWRSRLASTSPALRNAPASSSCRPYALPMASTSFWSGVVLLPPGRVLAAVLVGDHAVVGIAHEDRLVLGRDLRPPAAGGVRDDAGAHRLRGHRGRRVDGPGAAIVDGGGAYPLRPRVAGFPFRWHRSPAPLPRPVTTLLPARRAVKSFSSRANATGGPSFPRRGTRRRPRCGRDCPASARPS